ncbi:MAG: YcxB family protein [Butyrivibrio sp.]|uniref:YcxB family protein n=1 Tax=Butyrivibrio sp. TaxID=28121 RepID=UPI001B006704|nr:YcxB family protein [Butyrivibrio sp.]MBO6241388.1 YcxB family protein [Butyrivibrio sp.]
MEYKYICDIKASDLWKMAMLRTYKSVVGIVNIVFTVALFLLTIRFWGASSGIIKSFLVLGCILFPVIQPLATYGMSVKQLEALTKDIELTFNDKGLHVETGGQTQNIKWKNISNAIKRKNMIIIMSDDRHGYMLTDRVLGKEKDAFYDFLCSKITA